MSDGEQEAPTRLVQLSLDSKLSSLILPEPQQNGILTTLSLSLFRIQGHSLKADRRGSALHRLHSASQHTYLYF